MNVQYCFGNFPTYNFGNQQLETMTLTERSECNYSLFNLIIIHLYNCIRFILGLRVCLLQFAIKDDLVQTLKHLEDLVSNAVIQYDPEIIALPECFNFAYNTDIAILTTMAESIQDGITCRTLSKLSKQFGIYIVGGSIIERQGAELYNTSTVWNSNGELIARHRKVKCLTN